MGDKILVFIFSLPCPVTMLIVGLLCWKLPAEYKGMGYHTAYSESSPAAWAFAQVTYGKLAVIHNAVILALSIISGIIMLIFLPESSAGPYCLIVTTADLVIVFIDIFITENRLKKFFNRDGTLKNVK